jgi:hypothetical protein
MSHQLTDAERLRDEGKLALGRDFDAELPQLNDGTRLLALLFAFLRLALFGVDDGDSGEVVLALLVLAGLLLGRHGASVFLSRFEVLFLLLYALSLITSNG